MTEKAKRTSGAAVVPAMPAVSGSENKALKVEKVVKAAVSKLEKAPAAKSAKTVVAKVAVAKVKAAPVAKSTPAAVVAEVAKVEKHKKIKMVRDSFTMPENDYAQIAAIKDRCLKSSVSVKKSEVLRAALKCLSGLSDLELTKAITDLDIIKTGRPAKG